MTEMRQTNIEVKKTNRNQIFRYILRHNIAYNPDIAYDLRLSLPTVTQNTKELIQKGLLEEIGERESTGGRKAKALSISSNFKLAVGIDITKNSVSMLLVNLTGEVIKHGCFFIPFAASNDYYSLINTRLEGLLDESGADRDKILGIGLSIPGIIDFRKREIAYSHALDLNSVSFDSITCFFSYPCFFINDANAGAYAEGIRAGDQELFFYLSLSNTVGGAIFRQNELEEGKNFRCGEAGHMTVIPDGETCYCGKKGCLDVYCSAKKLSDAADGKLEDFFSALDAGDKKAMDIWEKYTDYLAIAINNIHMILDCDIILGGYVGKYLDVRIQKIRHKVSQRNTFSEDRAFVKKAGDNMGALLGAALMVIEEFIKQV